jgi:hypothetical protein
MSIKDKILSFSALLSQSIQMGKFQYSLIVVLQEAQLLWIYYYAISGSNTLGYYMIYLSLYPLVLTTLVCLYIGIGILCVFILLMLVAAITQIKGRSSNRSKLLKFVSHILLYYSRVGFLPCLGIFFT